MTLHQAWRRVIWIAVVAAIMFAFVSFNRFADEPAGVADVVRASAAMAGAYDQDLLAVLPRAALYRLNYMSEVAACMTYSVGRTRAVTSLRVWDGIAAALAVWLLYRVGTMCTNRLTAVAACAMLALMPPQSWHTESLRILVVTLHFETFLYAVRKDSLPRWVAYALVTLLLFCTGVYAEPLLLPGWHLTLAATWVMWRLCARKLPRRGGLVEPVRSSSRTSHSHNSSLWKQLQRDSGLLRFFTLLMIVTMISFGLVFVTGVFFSQFSLTLPVIVGMMAVSIVLSALSAGIMLIIPTFVRERTIIIDQMFVGELFRSFTTSEQVFRPIRLTSANRTIAAYAVASCAFLPVLYMVRKSLVALPPEQGAYAFLGQLMRQWSAWEWVQFAAPLLFVGTVFLGYLAGYFPRSRFIGACAVFIPSCLYLVLPRYAVFSVPFCLLCTTGFVVAACQAVLNLVESRFPKPFRIAYDHDA